MVMPSWPKLDQSLVSQWCIMSAMVSQITSLTIVYSTIYSGTDQRKHQSSTSLAFVQGIHRWPLDSPHNWPVTRKMFPFDNVIMGNSYNTVDSLEKSKSHVAQFGVNYHILCMIEWGDMSGMPYQITCNSTVSLTAWSGKKSIKALHY